MKSNERFLCQVLPLAIVVTILLNGCMSLDTGSSLLNPKVVRSKTFAISSDREGDELYLNGSLVGLTPCEVTAVWRYTITGDALNSNVVVVKRGQLRAVETLHPGFDSGTIESINLTPR